MKYDDLIEQYTQELKEVRTQYLTASRKKEYLEEQLKWYQDTQKFMKIAELIRDGFTQREIAAKIVCNPRDVIRVRAILNAGRFEPLKGQQDKK